jgi:hypothetical protein
MSKLAILICMVLVVLLMAVQGASMPEVQASEILTKIQKGEPVEYDHVTIRGDLDLSQLSLQTNINSPIRINDSTFDSFVSFNYTNLDESIDLSGSNFTKDAYFREATFSGDANFTGATFSEYPNFDRTAFSGDANFSNAAFGGYADFSGAMFSRYVDFTGATFSGDAVGTPSLPLPSVDDYRNQTYVAAAYTPPQNYGPVPVDQTSYTAFKNQILNICSNYIPPDCVCPSASVDIDTLTKYVMANCHDVPGLFGDNGGRYLQRVAEQALESCTSKMTEFDKMNQSEKDAYNQSVKENSEKAAKEREIALAEDRKYKLAHSLPQIATVPQTATLGAGYYATISPGDLYKAAKFLAEGDQAAYDKFCNIKIASGDMIRLNPGKKAYLEDIDGNVLRIRMQGDITEYYAFAEMFGLNASYRIYRNMPRKEM